MPNGAKQFPPSAQPEGHPWGKPKPPTLAKSDESRKRLGVVNPFSRTWGPTKVSIGMASSGIKKA